MYSAPFAFFTFEPVSFAVSLLGLFALTDLRYRRLPGVQLFFGLAFFSGLAIHPLQALAVAAAVWWGSSPERRPAWMLPALFHPAAWPVLLLGAGTRKGLIGGGDLFGLGMVACLFPWTAAWLTFVAVLTWVSLWQRKHPGPAPAIPGLLLGLLAYITLRPVLASLLTILKLCCEDRICLELEISITLRPTKCLEASPDYPFGRAD